jgi:hypothetical protein
MTKKHFEALAAALAGMGKSAHGISCESVCFKSVVNEVADVCARFNPTFDRARFLAACGVEG